MKFDHGRIVLVQKADNMIKLTWKWKLAGPESISYRFKDGKMEQYPSGNSALARAIQERVLFDEIDLLDETDSPIDYHPIQKLLLPTIRLLPTLIRYQHFQRGKSLLVSLPRDLDMSTFWKHYGTQLRRAHADFYDKTFKGRPTSKETQAKRILQVLNEYKGTKLSMDRLAEIASKRLDELGEVITPASIRCHYREALKTIKGSKK